MTDEIGTNNLTDEEVATALREKGRDDRCA